MASLTRSSGWPEGVGRNARGNDQDRHVWEIRNTEPDADTGENPVKFRDVVTRVAQ